MKSVLLLMMLLLSGCERYALDRKMEGLCKKDGGAKVYETVTLPPDEYEKLYKYVETKKTQEEYFGPDYRFVQTLEYIVGKDVNPEYGKGRLARGYTAIFRRADNKLLGEQVQYFRSGGDGFTFGLHFSSSSCPHFDRDINHLVFLKGN